MNTYIGTKLVKAEKMTRGEFNAKFQRAVPGEETDPGYVVEYEGGYTSWSPADPFEKAYMKLDGLKESPSELGITREQVDDFMAYYKVTTMGTKTTVVRCVLRNGFEIVESSSCVHPANYSEEIGKEICLEKIRDKIWELLGFLLQTAVNGIR